MASSINPDYGFSVTYGSQLIEAMFKFSDASEDKIELTMQFPFHPNQPFTEEDGTVTFYLSPGAPMPELIEFFEEIISTYKKYKIVKK